MSIPILIAVAVLAPVALAAAVGVPTWFAARIHGEYLRFRDEFRTVVGIPPAKPAAAMSSGGGRLPGWVLGYYGYLFGTALLRAIHPSLGFTAHVLLFAGIGLWSGQRIFSTYRILRAHPDLEPRLRRVPWIEMASWSLVALVAFALVHVLVVVGAPEAFGVPGRISSLGTMTGTVACSR